MAVSSSQSLGLGTEIPPFDLPCANPNVDSVGRPSRSPADYASKEVMVVVFNCNHCPFAVHVEDELIRIANDYSSKGVQLVIISSNDVVRYPQDGFDAMAERAHQKKYPFPYLYDESQDVARAFDAQCTPDAYVFDSVRLLRYRGRIDETRPGGEAAHGRDIRSAIQAILDGEDVSDEQWPSIGCGIKWK